MFLSVFATLSVVAADPVEVVLKCHKDDKVLIEKVNAAVMKATKISKVEKAVGVAATINTNNNADKEVLAITSIALYSNLSQIESIRDADEVVYWVLSVDTDNPIVVGIAWVKGEMKIFYGAVYPPG